MLSRKILLKRFGASLNLNISRGLCCTVASTSKLRDSLLISYKLNRPIYVKNRKFSLNSIGLSSKFAAQTDLQSGADSLLNGQNLSDIASQVGQIPDAPPIPSATDLLDTVECLGIFNSTPAGGVQMLLDFMHTNWGLEWWAAIAVLTVCVRLLTLPFVIYGQRGAARFQNHQPQFQKLQLNILNAKKKNDTFKLTEAQYDMSDYMKKHDINPFKRLVVMLPMATVFCTCFAAIRGLANAPYPGWETAGPLWFPNLCIADPWYILPLYSAFTVWRVIESGVETGVKLGDQDNPIMKYGMRIGLPVFVLIFTTWQPSALALYWCYSNSISLLLAQLFKMDSVRSVCGIEKLRKHERSPGIDIGKMKAWQMGKEKEVLARRLSAARQMRKDPIRSLTSDKDKFGQTTKSSTQDSSKP